MKLRIEIDMGNAAFEEVSGAEVARILHTFASNNCDRDLLPGDEDGLYDFNGNRVGTAVVEADEPIPRNVPAGKY